MQKLKVFPLFAAALIALVGKPVRVLAEESDGDFSATASNLPLAALQEAGDQFRTRGERKEIELVIPTRSGTRPLRFVAHDIRSANYRSVIQTKHGIESDPVRVDLFRADPADGDKKDFGRLALIRDDRTGRRIFRGYMSSRGKFYDLRSRMTTRGATRDALVVTGLSARRMRNLAGACGAAQLPITVNQSFNAAVETPLSSYPLIAEVATEADFEFTQQWGAEANAEILAILNGVDGIYRSELNITLQVSYQHAWQVPEDPYTKTDAAGLLEEFTYYWNSNFRGVERYDLAHLWTGRDLDGNTIGMAYYDAVCSMVQYGISQSMSTRALSIPLAAHEIGHNFNARHDLLSTTETGPCSTTDLYIMCPYIIPSISTFSPTSKSAISLFLGKARCLTPLVPVLPPPSNFRIQ